MINIAKILKRSWHILWNYRILWLFGILLALTTAGSGGGNGGGSSSSSQSARSNPGAFTGGLPDNAPTWVRDLYQWFVQNVVPLFTHPEQHITTFVVIGAVIFLVVLVISLLAALVRYPTETAVVRMVDEYERTGTKLGFVQGWKLGWTRRAFRLWLIDLLLGIPIFVLVLLLVGAGLIIFVSMYSAFQSLSVLGVVAAVGLGTLSIFLFIVAAVFLGLLRNFFMRAAALDGAGVFESFRLGWSMFWRNWKSAGLMWLVMIGIGIGFGILGLILFFLLIPVYLILLVPAVLVAALPALVALGITSIFASGPLAWIIAVLVAIPFFFLTLFFPLVVINGLYKIYESSVWTLTYREIKSLETVASPGLPPQPPAPAPSGPDATPVA